MSPVVKADPAASCRIVVSGRRGLPDLLPVTASTSNGQLAKDFFAIRFSEEFSLDSASDEAIPAAFAMLLLKPQNLSATQSQVIDSFLNRAHLENPLARKQGEATLGRKLTLRGQTALRIALIFDRDVSVMPKAVQSTEARYANAKIRLLALAGFSRSERDLLLASGRLRDDALAETRYSFSKQAGDLEPAALKTANLKIVSQAANWIPTKPAQAKRKLSLTKDEAQALLRSLSSNPVTTYERRRDYDPDGRRGFCFGRAFAGHLLAIKDGVDKDSIRKVFVSGPMRAGGINWQFHVAVMVAKTGGGFWVIDPNYFRPQTVAEWYNRYQEQSIDKRLRLYVTPASRFGGLGFAAYNRATLANSFYNHYFDDLLTYFRDAKDN